MRSRSADSSTTLVRCNGPELSKLGKVMGQKLRSPLLQIAVEKYLRFSVDRKGRCNSVSHSLVLVRLWKASNSTVATGKGKKEKKKENQVQLHSTKTNENVLRDKAS